MDKFETQTYVENAEPMDVEGGQGNHVVGTVQFFSQSERVLIPTPSPDPKGITFHTVQVQVEPQTDDVTL